MYHTVCGAIVTYDLIIVIHSSLLKGKKMAEKTPKISTQEKDSVPMKADLADQGKTLW